MLPRLLNVRASWVCVFLFALVAALYAQGVRHSFALIDDDEYILHNPAVAAGLTWHGLGWAFTTFHEANWHPLSWLSHMADVELFGLAPGGHHALSAGLHALNASLLFIALRRMTRRPWPSALVAVLFAVHPLHVEAVAWAAERKEVLAGSFWMLALFTYARYAERPSPRRYLAVFACMAVGLLAKPTLVTLPFALLLLDFWPLGRWAPARLAEKLPLLALSLASSVVTIAAQRAGGSLSDIDRLPVVRRLGNAAVAYLEYLKSALWPAKLAVFYPYPPGRSGAVAAVLLFLATWYAYRRRRELPYLLTGWLWFLGVAVPMIGIVQVGMQARADRYTYLPLIGLYFATAWAAADWVGAHPRARRAVLATICAALTALAAATWLQVATWKNARTLYAHALGVTRDNFIAHHGLGFELEKEGDLDGAAAEFAAALRINDSFARSHNSLGAIYARKGDTGRAAAEFERAVALDPRYPEPYFNLARVAALRGDTPSAARRLEVYLRLRPDDASARALLD